MPKRPPLPPKAVRKAINKEKKSEKNAIKALVRAFNKEEALKKALPPPEKAIELCRTTVEDAKKVDFDLAASAHRLHRFAEYADTKLDLIPPVMYLPDSDVIGGSTDPASKKKPPKQKKGAGPPPEPPKPIPKALKGKLPFLGIAEIQRTVAAIEAKAARKRDPSIVASICPPTFEAQRSGLQIRLQERLQQMRQQRGADIEHQPAPKRSRQEEPVDDADLEFGRFQIPGQNEGKERLPPTAVLLKRAEAKRRREEEEGPEAVEAAAWDSAMSRAAGEKVRDDPALLKKTLKREEAQKRKSARQWEARGAQASRGGRPGFEGGRRVKNKEKYKPKREKRGPGRG